MLAVQHVKTSDILSFADERPHETVIVMPSTRVNMARRAADVMVDRTEAPGLLIMAEDDCRLGFVAAANLVYSKTSSRYFCYTAQDAFAGYYWLDMALETMQKERAGLLAFNDGRFFGSLAAFGLVDRQWSDSLYGGKALFYPHYQKTYCDTELTDIARMTGKLAYNAHSMLVEVDYGRHANRSEMPPGGAIRYLEPDATDPDGVLYVTRALGGFDGKVRPFVPQQGPVQQVVKARRAAGHSIPD